MRHPYKKLGLVLTRPAKPADLESILQLAERKVYPSWPSQAPLEKGLAFLRGLRESEEWAADYDLFVIDETSEITGFLVLKKQLVRGLTGDRESVIQDWFAARESCYRSLFEYAVTSARSYGSQFLTTEVSSGDDDGVELLESFGFKLESYRISVLPAHCRLPEGSPYLVRPAVEEDAYLIAVLNSTMLSHTLSAGRDYNLSELTFQAMAATMGQVSRQDSQCAGLVLTLNGGMVGHLLLEISDRMGYIYDLALEREHWGGTAVRHLMRSGSRLLFERNIPLFVGDVSASNRRALIVAQRALGFTVDCQRYGFRLQPKVS